MRTNYTKHQTRQNIQISFDKILKVENIFYFLYIPGEKLHVVDCILGD